MNIQMSDGIEFPPSSVFNVPCQWHSI